MQLRFSLLEAFVWKRYLVSALICSSLVLCLGGRPLFSIVFNYLLEADEELQQVKLFRTDWHVLEAFAPDTKRVAVGPSSTTKRELSALKTMSTNASHARYLFITLHKRDPESADPPPSPEVSNLPGDEDSHAKRILEDTSDLCGWGGAQCIKAEITPVASWSHADIGLVNSMLHSG